MRWSKDITQWSFFTAPIIYIILMLFDKLWFVFFFGWKSLNWTIFCAWMMLLFSLLYTVIVSISGNLEEAIWLPAVLTIPFNFLMIYSLIFSYNWKF